MTALRPFCMRGGEGGWGGECTGDGGRWRGDVYRSGLSLGTRLLHRAYVLCCAATVGTRCHPSYNILHIIPTLAPPPPMAAYHALTAMAENPNSSSSLSIRGAASAPSRVVASALRGAGISARSAHGMDVDVDGDRGVVRRGAPARRARPSGPLDQVGASAFTASVARTHHYSSPDWPASSTTGHATGR